MRQERQQQRRQPGQQAQVRRSTDPGGHLWRPTQPVPISGAGGRPQTPPPPLALHQQHNGGSTGGLRRPNRGGEADSAVLSQLLDDTVQLLGQSTLMTRQESAPAIVVLSWFCDVLVLFNTLTSLC